MDNWPYYEFALDNWPLMSYRRNKRAPRADSRDIIIISSIIYCLSILLNSIICYCIIYFSYLNCDVFVVLFLLQRLWDKSRLIPDLIHRGTV